MTLDKDCALNIRELALEAITNLSKALERSQGKCSTEDFERIKEGVGLSIAHIQTWILDPIYAQYPDLDDLVSGKG
jgi:hypothetical protein